MTKKTRSKKDGKGREEEWSWEESPEVTAALRKLHEGASQSIQKGR